MESRAGVKIKYNDFTVQTRSRTINKYIDTKADIWPVALELLEQDELTLPIRLLGISLSNLAHLKKEVIPKDNPQLKFAF